jgi:hypothetical protein
MTMLLQLLLMVAPHLADAPRRFVREIDLGGAKRKTGRVYPVTGVMLRPAPEAGKALSLPRCSVFAPLPQQKPPKSGIYPAISRLEPEFNLGQKGALPARWASRSGKNGMPPALSLTAGVLDGAVAERLKAAVC